MTIVPSYTGPQCPRCGVALTSDWIRSGAMICPFCGRTFEATAFSPPPRKQVATTEVVTVGPEGANACANHARNAATASCQRCGLFICGLCDMNVGSGSYCPSCFDAAPRRYRDFATMARSSAIAGILLITVLGLPLGVAAMYYGVKARRQRRQEGRSTAGVTITIIVGLLEALGSLAAIIFILYAIGKAAT
jgi:uncharacterized paraquat-inducible protein A